LGWEKGHGSGFADEISMLLNQPEQDQWRQKRRLPAVIFVFICFSKVDLPKAGNGFPPHSSCEERVCAGTQSAKPLGLFNMKLPLVAAVFPLSFFSFLTF